MASTKVITAADAATLIKDGATLYCSGVGLAGFAEEVAIAIQARFQATGHPRDMSIWHACGLGNAKDKGIYHLTQPGMIKRIVGGHFGVGGPILMKLIMEDRIEAYNLPAGRAGGAAARDGRRPSGADHQGRAGNLRRPPHRGRQDQRGHHRGPRRARRVRRRAVAVLPRAQDRRGADPWHQRGRERQHHDRGRGHLQRVDLDRAGRSAQRRHRHRAGPARRQNGTLHPKHVKVPGILVDYVVIGRPENHMQTMGTQYNRAYTGDVRVPVHSLPRLPLDERKIIARRAAIELGHGAIVNLGIGVPAGIATVAAEEKRQHLMALTLETGPHRRCAGRRPGLRPRHQRRRHPRPRLPVRLLRRRRLDVAFLGLAQTDVQGNVNVSKFSGRPVGCGGFINITQNAKKVVFCGTFTAGGLQVRAGNGRLKIVREGTSRKFLDQVEQITFSGHYAAGVPGRRCCT
jgi:propionate CoA-transferase